MSTALTAAAAVAHPGFWGAGFFPFFIFIPIFWILVIGLIVFLVTRNRRRFWANGGYGPWGYGHPGGWHGGWQAGRSAEATLADRFANGDIDEKEYRARLEVLRANLPQPPQPPQR
jgi:putative membrane protein